MSKCSELFCNCHHRIILIKEMANRTWDGRAWHEGRRWGGSGGGSEKVYCVQGNKTALGAERVAKCLNGKYVKYNNKKKKCWIHCQIMYPIICSEWVHANMNTHPSLLHNTLFPIQRNVGKHTTNPVLILDKNHLYSFFQFFLGLHCIVYSCLYSY